MRESHREPERELESKPVSQNQTASQRKPGQDELQSELERFATKFYF